MTDRKLTEAEMISYLELSVAIGSTARLAPEEAKILLDLIKRQKAEIERLEKSLADQFDSYENIRKKAKSEAVNEFAESLKEKAYPFPCAIGVEWAVPFVAIDTLVKEMTK